MHLLLLALACDTTEPNPEGTDTGNLADTGTNDTADTSDTSDTADTADTDTATGDDADADGYVAPEDCDDTNAAIHPGATDTCDGVDENCDGSIDEGNASLALLVEGPGDGSITNGTWYGYDANDNQVLSAGDLDMDGVFNWYVRSQWVNGFMVAEQRSNDGMSVASYLEYDREADGSITEWRYDSNGDGAWEYSQGYTYVDGLNTGFWMDSNYDGVIDYAYGWVYNSDGMMTYYWEDIDGNGVYNFEAIYTYDGDQMISGSTDGDGDGVFETSQVNTWVGERPMEELVTGGANPYRRTYAYTDADDYWDTSDYDVNDDGSVDYRFTQTSDADGTTTSRTTDQNADGVGVTSATYEVDAEGSTHTTNYLDGVVISVYEYEYNDDGSYAAMRYDYNGDGYWEYVYEYDTFGHLIYGATDATSDGVIDSIQTWSYDERGRRFGATTDALGDGTFEYAQWPRDGYACGAM